MKPPTNTKVYKKAKRRINVNRFIDDECGVSGDDSEDDENDLSFVTQQNLNETNADEGDPNIDMHAKYLQSIRFVFEIISF